MQERLRHPAQVGSPAVSLGPNYRKLFTASTISNLGDGISVIAYPWLASAITRNPVLIALIVAAQRLPWLVFTLPAGVITDRNDRRLLMSGANAVRFVLTAAVALAVFVRRDDLPAPDAVDQVVGTDSLLYVILLVATLLLGVCEVIYDNSAQTFMPALVPDHDLEKANGRLYSAETVANQFAGPSVAGLLLAIGFALPFLVDAGTFAASAALVFSIGIRRRPERTGTGSKPQWRAEIAEGFRWLWHHPVLRTMALSLGALNLLGNVSFALFVIYAQEVLGTSTTAFAILSTAPAVGGLVGGWSTSPVVKRLGPGLSLRVSVVVMGLTTIAAGLVSSWPVVGVLLAVSTFFVIVWNVITVSFRQSVIPDRLLGRVNSVYRFLGWGAIPIGALLGGVLVAVLDGPLARETALRVPWVVSGVATLAMLVMIRPLTTERLESIRAAGREPASGAVDPASR
jgi:MFS family permease